MFLGHPFDVGLSGGFASGPTASLLREADFVLAIGASLNFYTAGEADFLFPNAAIARIDIAPASPGLNHLPGLYAQGDARAAALALREEIEKRQASKTGFRTPATEAALRQQLPLPPKPSDGLDPRRLMRALSAALPRDAMVATGSAHFWTFPMMHLALPEGGLLEYSGDFGEIGSGVPLGLGTAIGTPGRAHVVIEGDGSIMQHLQELETAVRCGIQLVVVVMNDAGYGAEVHKLRSKNLGTGMAQWDSPDFVAVARALGGDGVLLKSENEIGDAVKKGIAAGGLYLIDARTSPTAFNDRYGKIFFGVKNQAPLLRRGLSAD
jgi:thiamine pyrophosphate-dependent acetolactate synthase large subunit-like protein